MQGPSHPHTQSAAPRRESAAALHPAERATRVARRPSVESLPRTGDRKSITADSDSTRQPASARSPSGCDVAHRTGGGCVFGGRRGGLWPMEGGGGVFLGGGGGGGGVWRADRGGSVFTAFRNALNSVQWGFATRFRSGPQATPRCLPNRVACQAL